MDGDTDWVEVGAGRFVECVCEMIWVESMIDVPSASNSVADVVDERVPLLLGEVPKGTSSVGSVGGLLELDGSDNLVVGEGVGG